MEIGKDYSALLSEINDTIQKLEYLLLHGEGCLRMLKEAQQAAAQQMAEELDISSASE